MADGVNGNVTSSIVVPNGATGNQTGLFQNTGVAVNGSANDASFNQNTNNITTGANTNQNVVQPVILTPTQSQSSGGNSALVLPRNPLALPNANLGRSNFGLQFGVQNNPGLGGFAGGNNALGWFMQGGVTVPFGKIPDVYNAPQNAKLDMLREDQMVRERMVFGQIVPRGAAAGQHVETRVEGRINGGQQSAYNFTTIPSSKISLPDSLQTGGIGEIKIPQPKVLALSPAEVYTRPLNTGSKIGVVEVGTEYPYLGHTKSGWVKLLLPNGTEGWTSTQFEYIKNDFTQIDDLAVDPTAGIKKKTASSSKKGESVKVVR